MNVIRILAAWSIIIGVVLALASTIHQAGAAPAIGLEKQRATLAPGTPVVLTATPFHTSTPVPTLEPYPAPGEHAPTATATPTPSPAPSPTATATPEAYPAPEAIGADRAPAAAPAAGAMLELQRARGADVRVVWQAPEYACLYLANQHGPIALIPGACGYAGALELPYRGVDGAYTPDAGDALMLVTNGNPRRILATVTIPPFTTIMPVVLE